MKIKRSAHPDGRIGFAAGTAAHAGRQLLRFGREQALSCLFPVAIFAALAVTRMLPLPLLPRYDWLLMLCLLIQVAMVRSGLETRDELKVIWIDVRGWLFALVLIVFARSRVTYRVGTSRYRMPIVASFALIGFFIWIAENIATFFGAWTYPNQSAAWTLVHPGKVGSWLLLVIVSFLIVATLKRIKVAQPGLRKSEPGKFE